MSKEQKHYDAIGNELHLKDLVAFSQAGPIVGRIIEIKEGGVIATPGSTKPSILRIVIDCNIMSIPGLPCTSVLKVTDPVGIQIVDHIANANALKS